MKIEKVFQNRLNEHRIRLSGREIDPKDRRLNLQQKKRRTKISTSL